MITLLKEKEIFVFGSNKLGQHLGGAAKQAHDCFGAIWGQEEGLQGKAYAIPTMGTFEDIEKAVVRFINFAENAQEYKFLLTKIGCGIANLEEKKIKKLFEFTPLNIIKPEDWL